MRWRGSEYSSWWHSRVWRPERRSTNQSVAAFLVPRMSQSWPRERSQPLPSLRNLISPTGVFLCQGSAARLRFYPLCLPSRARGSPIPIRRIYGTAAKVRSVNPPSRGRRPGIVARCECFKRPAPQRGDYFWRAGRRGFASAQDIVAEERLRARVAAVNRLALSGHAAFCRASPNALGRCYRSWLARQDVGASSSRELAHRWSRAKPFKQISSAGRLAKASVSAVNASWSGLVMPRPQGDWSARTARNSGVRSPPKLSPAGGEPAGLNLAWRGTGGRVLPSHALQAGDEVIGSARQATGDS